MNNFSEGFGQMSLFGLFQLKDSSVFYMIAIVCPTCVYRAPGACVDAVPLISSLQDKIQPRISSYILCTLVDKLYYMILEMTEILLCLFNHYPLIQIIDKNWVLQPNHLIYKILSDLRYQFP